MHSCVKTSGWRSSSAHWNKRGLSHVAPTDVSFPVYAVFQTWCAALNLASMGKHSPIFCNLWHHFWIIKESLQWTLNDSTSILKKPIQLKFGDVMIACPFRPYVTNLAKRGKHHSIHMTVMEKASDLQNSRCFSDDECHFKAQMFQT